MQTAAGFVHCVNGFVGEATLVHEPAREFHTSLQSLFRVGHMVEVLVASLEVFQYLKRFFGA